MPVFFLLFHIGDHYFSIIFKIIKNKLNFPNKNINKNIIIFTYIFIWLARIRIHMRIIMQKIRFLITSECRASKSKAGVIRVAIKVLRAFGFERKRRLYIYESIVVR